MGGVGRKTLCLTAGMLLVASLAAIAGAQSKPALPPMQCYETRYYTLYSDADAETVKEASARLTVMAEEYHNRTRSFAGTIRQRLPVFLFAHVKDYRAAGGIAGSTGLYNGKCLMAVSLKAYPQQTWRLLQHEGFHQFAHMVIRGKLPIWVNEGLAEYFGQAVWTGDNFVAGLVPPQRLGRIKLRLRGGEMMPFETLLAMDYDTWVAGLSGRNYDQAWSMVHFLVHADGGKYRQAFEGYIADMSKGKDWKGAFVQRFGATAEEFESRYKQWWLSLPEEATADRQSLAVVQTLSSFLARAWSQGQTFGNADSFLRAAWKGELRPSPAQWLPPGLLQEALDQAEAMGHWSLVVQNRQPRLVLRQEGRTLVGTFTVDKNLVQGVSVEVTVSPASPSGRSR